MDNESLKTLFTTIAQVTFTLGGLMAVAIAGDSKRREYWFKNKGNSSFISAYFLLLFFPGLVAIGGLIPIYLKSGVPSWPVTTLIISIIYLVFSFVYRMNKNNKEPTGLNKIHPRMFSMAGYSLYGILLAVFGVSAYWTISKSNISQIESFLGVILFVSILDSTFLTVSLFRTDEEKEKISTDMVIKEDKTNQPYSVEHIIISDGKLESGLYVLFGLILAALAYIPGKLSKQ